IEDVELIRQQVQRCSEILGQLGAESGEVIGEMPQPTTLREVVDPLAAEHPRLVVELEDDSTQRLPLRAMRRVLLSLVENAEQASRDDAPVTLRARPLADDQVEIVVEDEGEGMPAEVLAHARDPFFTTKSEGLGLGLFLASAVVEQLGGTLELDTTPREGTRVRIRYPRLALEGNVSSPRHHR
ncbi:MAG: sensor histidine kinase, partial [Myxococcales bacterium]|nr:sensor histidine kinase [Myxococcales bacterium]